MQAHRPHRIAALLSCLAVAAAAALAPHVAGAAPVRLGYAGSVSGSLFDPRVLLDHPLGTVVSWEFTLDDAFTGVNALRDDVPGVANQSTRGTLDLGTAVYDLTAARLSSYSYEPATGNINWFMFQIEGAGPVTANDGDFYGLFVRVGPDLGLFEARVGFGYDFGGGGGSGTNYGYLETTGSYRVERLAVPLPGTLPLLALGLLGLAGFGASLRTVTDPASPRSR